jgi:hypothetical protein
LDALFSIYDTDRSGALDYKEFCVALYDKGASGSSPSKGGSGGGSAEDLVERLR